MVGNHAFIKIFSKNRQEHGKELWKYIKIKFGYKHGNLKIMFSDFSCSLTPFIYSMIFFFLFKYFRGK